MIVTIIILSINLLFLQTVIMHGLLQFQTIFAQIEGSASVNEPLAQQESRESSFVETYPNNGAYPNDGRCWATNICYEQALENRNIVLSKCEKVVEEAQQTHIGSMVSKAFDCPELHPEPIPCPEGIRSITMGGEDTKCYNKEGQCPEDGYTKAICGKIQQQSPQQQKPKEEEMKQKIYDYFP